METVQHVKVEDYLAGELRSEVRHEYLGGVVYAMAGASEEHNVLAGNFFRLFTPTSATARAKSSWWT